MSDINKSDDQFKNDTHEAAKRIMGRDPLPWIRWVNMGLGLALLVFGVLGFISTFADIFKFDSNVVMTFFFSLYQL